AKILEANMKRKNDPGAGDEALIGRFLEGDERCLTSLMERHGPTMRRVAHAILLRSDLAEEVVQEAWIAFLDHLSGGGTFTKPGAWLRVCVRHLALDRTRRRAARG